MFTEIPLHNKKCVQTCVWVILSNFSYLMPPSLPFGAERKLSLSISIKLFCNELCFMRF